MYNLQRQEINHLKELGYKWDDLFDIIKIFENKISKYTGAPYVTVTDCCTHALELSFTTCLHISQCANDVEKTRCRL